jgi:hypothetical protein
MADTGRIGRGDCTGLGLYELEYALLLIKNLI